MFFKSISSGVNSLQVVTNLRKKISDILQYVNSYQTHQTILMGRGSLNDPFLRTSRITRKLRFSAKKC